MVSLEGKVYTCGNNLSQKLGLMGKTDIDKIRPFSEVNIDLEPKAVAVACGFSHSMALLEDGTVVSWGGSLGQKRGNLSENAQERHIPKPLSNFTYVDARQQSIPLKIKIKAIAAGQYHSMAISTEGKLFCWGSQFHWQLGHPDDREDQGSPRLVMFFERN